MTGKTAHPGKNFTRATSPTRVSPTGVDAFLIITSRLWKRAYRPFDVETENQNFRRNSASRRTQVSSPSPPLKPPLPPPPPRVATSARFRGRLTGNKSDDGPVPVHLHGSPPARVFYFRASDADVDLLAVNLTILLPTGETRIQSERLLPKRLGFNLDRRETDGRHGPRCRDRPINFRRDFARNSGVSWRATCPR